MWSTCQAPTRATSRSEAALRPVQPCPATAVRRWLQPRQSLSGRGRPPILRIMRRQPIDPVFTAEPEAPAHPCDHPGCEAGGNFRAPKSRLELHDYRWFCLEHVRAYNLAWNYYAGMSQTEV